MKVDGATGAKAPVVTATGIGSIALLGPFIFRSTMMLRSRGFESILVWFILVWSFSVLQRQDGKSRFDISFFELLRRGGKIE